MPRDINTVIEQLKDQPQNMPIELYQIFLDTETRYLACYTENIQFFDENGNPQIYEAAAIKRTAIETNTDTKVDQCEVAICNVSREMSDYIAQTDFVGKELAIWKVFVDDLSSPDNYIQIFKGEMDAPKIDQYQMSVTVVSKLDTLDKKLPARTYQTDCPWQFGSEECGVIIPQLTGQIIELGSYADSNEQYVVIDEAYDSNIAQKFRQGSLDINGQKRKVSDIGIADVSGTDYLRITLAFRIPDVEEGDAYTLIAGCDKGYGTSHGCEYWENTQFYGGFLSIPESKIQEF